MSLPFGKLLKIVNYWEFWDFPRYILALDDEGGFWVLEGSFDDILDDYPGDFVIRYSGTDSVLAQKQFESRELVSIGEDRLRFDRIPLRRIRFDDTKRRTVMIV